jgi:hypothetical protein
MSLILSGSDGVSDIDGTVSTPAIRGTDSNTGIFFPAADTIAFSEGGVESMRIDSAGDVGIGNTSPYAKLQTYQSSSTLPVQYAYRGTQGSDGSLPTTYGFPYLQIGRTEFRTNSLQTIGFGYIATDGNNPPAEIGYLTTSTSGETLGDLVFATRSVTTNTAASERMRITSAGSLNIGATSGTGRLYVESDNNVVRFVATNSTAGTEVIVQNNLLNSNNATASDYFFIGAVSGGSDRVYILGNGNLQNINGSYGTISDANLKENIIDATPKLDKVMQLKVRNFNFIDDELKQIGFVAQELETVFPGLIEESQNLDRDGKRTGTTRKAVKTTVLIPILVKAMQEQQAMIQELKAELDATKAEVTALKAAP